MFLQYSFKNFVAQNLGVLCCSLYYSVDGFCFLSCVQFANLVGMAWDGLGWSVGRGFWIASVKWLIQIDVVCSSAFCSLCFTRCTCFQCFYRLSLSLLSYLVHEAPASAGKMFPKGMRSGPSRTQVVTVCLSNQQAVWNSSERWWGRAKWREITGE